MDERKLPNNEIIGNISFQYPVYKHGRFIAVVPVQAQGPSPSLSRDLMA
jgi:hypothetical protein